MKLKYIIALIALSCIVIIYNSQGKSKPYLFTRKIVQDSVTKIHSIIDKNIKEHEFLYAHEDTLLSYKQQHDSLFLLDLYSLTGDSFIKHTEIELPIPQIVATKQNSIFYINKFQLCKQDINDGERLQLSPNDCYIYNSYPINMNLHICLGTKLMDGQYITGFYLLENKNVRLVKQIESNKDTTSIYMNSLAYSGSFTKSKKYISYYCNKMSHIYIFNLDAQYIAHVRTKENVPEPEIFLFNGIYLYKRGHTFQTNIGMYEQDDYIHVLSYRTEHSQIILDKYSIKSGKYTNSYTINENCNNKFVNSVFQYNSLIVINLQDRFISLQLL